MNLPGYFITIEGVDGTGKTTQARLLAERLRSEHRYVLSLHLPGGTDLGDIIRELLLYSEIRISRMANLLLQAASMNQLLREVIIPAVDDGFIVVCDRYVDSTFAYQGFGKKLGIETVAEIILTAIQEYFPDTTILLDMDYEVALQRLKGEGDNYEKLGPAFFERVVEGYRWSADEDPNRVIRVDAAPSVEEVAEDIYTIVKSRMKVDRAKFN